MKEYWFPFSPAKYREDTMHLTAEQDGIYLRLILHYMETGAPLPDNDQALARIAGVSHETFIQHSEILKNFYRKSGEKLHHKKCDGILANQAERKQSYSDRKKGKFKNTDIKKTNKIKAEKSVENLNDISRSATVHNNIDVLLEKEPKAQKQNLKPPNVSEETWQDFLKHRKAKKAPVTETVLNTIATEAERAGWPMEDALKEICMRGWQGFKAEWVQNKSKGENHETNRNGNAGARISKSEQARAAALRGYHRATGGNG